MKIIHMVQNRYIIVLVHVHRYMKILTSCFGLLTDSAVVVSALVVSALGKSGLNMDVPALSYMYAAYGKSGLISNGKE